MTSELELLDLIATLAPERGGTVVGVGDDAAVLAVGPEVVVTQDLLVDGVHFRRATTSLRDLGEKALAVNLSDLAAMGARPRAAVIGIAAPPGALDEGSVTELYTGVDDLAARHDTTIAGGDVTSGPALVLAVTAIGEMDSRVAPVLRSGARHGDAVAVTGALGAAAAGLRLLDEPGLADAVGRTDADSLRAAHLRPQPRVAAGLALAAGGAHAMMDLSDGIALDGLRMARASGTRIRVDLDALPLAAGVEDVASAEGRDARELAATAGDDYELLVAAPPALMDELGARLDVPLAIVGAVADGAPGVDLHRGGSPVDGGLTGFSHEL